MRIRSYYCLSFMFATYAIGHSIGFAADITWVGGNVNQSGNWSNAENWDTGNVPSADDRAFITAGGSFTVTLDVDAKIAGLVIGDPQQKAVSQILLLSTGRALTVTENFDWHGGTIRGPGTLANIGNMNITRGFVQTLNDGAFIDNAGTINITSTQFRAGGGAILNNLPGAAVILHDDADANASFQAAPVLNLINQGFVLKADGDGKANWALGYSSEGGTVDVKQGTLVLGRGGKSLGGTIMVAQGATLDFSSPEPHTFSGAYEGIVAGNVILDTSIDPKGANFKFEDFNWFGGSLTGPGTLRNDGVLNLNAGSVQTMNEAAAIDNAGVINITSTEFRGGGGATINNFPGGSLILHDGSDASASFQVAPPLNLINQGLVVKPDGPGIANWALTYSNEGGIIDVKQGTLILGLGGRSLGGTMMVAPDATLDFSSSVQHIFSGSYDGIVDGNVILDTGIDLAGAGFFFQNFNWFGGTLTGPGTLRNEGVLNITAGSVQTMNDAASIENLGTINISSTEFRGGGGAVITNRPSGTFVIEDGADANNAFQVAPALVLINEGLVAKLQGQGTANWALTYSHKGGTIDVQAGTLKLALGGSSSGGALNVSVGATLDFTSAGQHTFSGTYTGSVDGDVILDTAIDPAGASFDFQNFNWFGGILRGPGTLKNDQVLNITAGSIQTMNDDAAIENLGTINISSPEFRGGGGAVITNRPSGSFVMEDGVDANSSFQVAPPLVFINEGLVAKPQGAGTASWALFFNHQGGTIDVQAGTLKLAFGGNSTGGAVNVNAGATLDFTSSGQHTFSGTYTGTVAGNVVLDTAIDPRGANFSFQSFNWFGGTFTGPGTLRNDGVLNITAGSVQTMNDTASIDNAGTINFSSTEFRGGGGAVITNLQGGSFVLQDGADANPSFQAAPVLNLINQGVVTKPQGSGIAAWRLDFNNDGGTIEVLSGVLQFTRGYIQKDGLTSFPNGNFLVSGGDMDIQGGTVTGRGSITANIVNNGALLPGGSPGILTINGNYTQLPLGTLNIEIGGQIGGSELDQLNITGAATLSGTMNVSLINGFVPVEGNQFTVMTYGSRSGAFEQINGLDLGGGLTLTPNFTVNTLFLETGGSALTASPPSLDFGDVLVGSSSVRQVTFTNNGATSVTVGSIGATGANPESFIIDPTPFTLDPEESQTLDVDFTPGFAGSFSADLVIASETLTITVPMTGSGIEDATDREALEDLYNSTDGPNWTNNTNWLSQAPVSRWFGVLVENDRVTALDLSSNNLVGTLPGTIGNLTGLVEIFLQGNKLSGPIPPTIGNLGDLTILALNNNLLDGAIPGEIGNLTNLGRLQLEANQLLGAIPLEIGNLINLIDLRLDVNLLSGAIPNEIGNLIILQNLELADNRLSGAVPLEVTNLARLGILFLNDNLLVDLPDLSGLQTLKELHIQNNQFTFEDIEPNLGVPNFTYAPQDSVETTEERTVLLGSTLSLSVAVDGENNLYQWSKDAVDIAGATVTTLTLDPVDFSDAAVYGCRITNSLATNLILQRRPITVVVGAPEQVRVDIPSPPTAGSEQTLTISSPADFQPTIKQMFYRMAGQEVFQVTLLSQSGNEFQGTIPSDFVTIRGIEYYVSLSDGRIAVTFPETDPISDPAILPVQVIRLDYPIPLQPKTFKMISVPLALTSTQIDSVLMDDYGEYEVLPRQWRIFRLQNGVYAEHLAIPEAFENGTAFWLITREGRTFDFENAQSVNSGEPIVLTLEPGFNQIGNPFAFPVAWSDISARGSVQPPIPFDGVEYLLPVSVLEPFDGYFVFNFESTPVTLTVPVTEASVAARQAVSKFSAIGATGYAVQLVATVPGTKLRDTQNFVGFRAGATAAIDDFDLFSPPPIGDYVRLDVLDMGYRFATNYKAINQLGQEWLLELTSTSNQKPIQVTLQESGNMPDGFHLFIFDEDLQTLITLREGSFTLQPEANLELRRLRLVIGTSDFAEQNSDGIPLVPIEFALAQNYPNPFNPETTIEYRIGKVDEVRLEIFNLLGQKIRTLVTEEQPAGVYSVKWNGLDDLGAQVASAVYVYRLRSGGRTATRKLLLMQ